MLGDKCAQGINFTFTSSENPVKGTMLSQSILPYLKYPMDVTISHDISGGGQSGVRISGNLGTAVMLLGFLMPQIQFTVQSIPTMVPDLSSDVNKLLGIVNDVKAQATTMNQLVMSNTGKTLVNQEAQRIISEVRSLNEKVESILSMTAALSQKLSSHTSNPMVSGFKAQLQSIKTNMVFSAKSLKLDTKRSPVTQRLKGISIGMMSQVCIGRLCVPYVKTKILASNDATTACISKNANTGATAEEEFPFVLISPSKNIKLGKLLQVKEGEEMRMDVSKNRMRFKPRMNLFGMRKAVDLNITDQQLNVRVRGNMFNKFESEINVTADTNVDEWEALVFKASGKIDDKLPQMLENSVNKHAITLVQKAENRIRKAKTLLESNINKTKSAWKISISKRKRWDLLNRNKTILEMALGKNRAAYDEAFIYFEDAVKDHERYAKDLLSKSCNLTDCKRLCTKSCIPDMCWDKAIIKYQKHDCVKVNAKYIKFVPGRISRTVTYPTTPMIRRDVGKCKSFFTALGEGLIKGAASLAMTTLLGKRKKRSITGFQNIPNFNDFLRKSNPNLPRDFDMNTELRKLSGKLPKDFDFNKLLASYLVKQHNFDPSEILKKHFPALPADFDFDTEVAKAVPELRNDFDLDQVMKDVILKAKRLKRKADLKSELVKRIPELRNTDIDRVLKRLSPPLRSMKDITGQIQSSLDDVLSFKPNNALLDRFDVNDIIKTKLRGLHRDVDLNKLLRERIPQLGENFNLNKVLSDAVKLNPANVGDLNLDKLVAGAMGSIPGLQNFNLQESIQNVVPGFAKALNFRKLIKGKLQDLVKVAVDPLKFANLNFNNIIRNQLPIVKDLGISSILKKTFSLGGIPKIGNIIGDAGPLMNVVKDFNLNGVLKGAFRHLPRNFKLNMGAALAKFFPALRGLGNIEDILKGGLKEFLNPAAILAKIPGLSGVPGFDKFLDMIGKGSFGDAMKAVKNIFNKDFFGKFAGAFEKFGPNLLNDFLGSFGNIIGSSLISAFTNSGCKHKYVTEVGPTEYRSYVETRAIMVGKEFTEVKWSCTNSRMVNMTSEGFEPRSCCRKDIPCVEFLDPQCLKRNQECFKQKKVNEKMERSDYNATILFEYAYLIQSEKELAQAELQLEEARLQEQNAALDYKIVNARFKQLQALENASRISLSKIKSIPDVNLGLKLKTILDKSYKKRPLRMSALSFRTVTSSLSNSRLPLRGTVTTKDGPDLTFSFIMDFEDVHSSIDHTTKSVIQKLAQSISGTSRKRRSVEIDFSNSSQALDPIEENEKCLLARNTSLFFSEILNGLHKLLESKYAQENEISNEITALGKLEVGLADDASGSSENDLTKTYAKAISLYKEQRNEQSRMVSWNETIVGWRNFVENITENRNLQHCSNALDCVEDLSERLVELYGSVKNNTKAREVQTLLPRLADGMKELMEEELQMEEVKSKLQNLSILLNKTYDDSVLCGEKPIMLTNDNKQVKRLIGESIKLSCLAKSPTEVIYTWRRDDTVIKISDKSGDLELRSLNETSQGLYRCEASNHKGASFSGITALVIQRKPTIVENPTDIQVALDKQSGVTFSCAVQAKPLATIKWLFEPLSSNLSVEMTNENSNLLYIVPDEVEKSGYYYCEASNERGKAVSRKARLDVLGITATNPKIAVIFNATNECAASSCQAGQNNISIPSYLDKTLKTSIRSLVTRSMNVSRKSISHIRYLPLSKSKAKVYFFLSSESVQLNAIDTLQDKVMEKFAEARVNVVGKLKRLMHAMNKTTFATQGSKANLVGIAKTLGFLYMAPDCPPGQYLHDNGYLCGECNFFVRTFPITSANCLCAKTEFWCMGVDQSVSIGEKHKVIKALGMTNVVETLD